MEATPRIPMLFALPTLFALFDDGIHRGDTDETYPQRRYKVLGASRALRAPIFLLYDPPPTIHDRTHNYTLKMRPCSDISSVLQFPPSSFEAYVKWGSNRMAQPVLFWPTGYQLYYPAADLWIHVLDTSVHQDYPGQYIYSCEEDTAADCRRRQYCQRQIRSRIMGVPSQGYRPPTPIPTELDLTLLVDAEEPVPSAPAPPAPAPPAPAPPSIPKFVAEALKRDAISKGESCPITMRLLSECQSLTLTSCYHLFEASSLAQWMTKSSSCPLCKQAVTSQISA